MSQKIIFAFIIVREKNPLYGIRETALLEYLDLQSGGS